MSTDMHEDEPSPTERIQSLLQEHWVTYPRARDVLTRLEELLEYPSTHRPPNLAVIAESNNGKSMLLQRFFGQNLPVQDAKSVYTVLPVLLVDAPPEADEGRLYSEMMEALLITGPVKEPAGSKLGKLKVTLKNLETRLIMIDEFHNLLAGSPAKLRKTLNAIRSLGNKLRIPIVVAGTLEVQRVLATDPQTANRFEPMILPRWKANQDFARLMLSIEPALKLKHASGLAERDMVIRIIDESEGLLGDAVSLLRRLAKGAIEAGEEKIVPEMFEPAHLKKLNWVRPSKRAQLGR